MEQLAGRAFAIRDVEDALVTSLGQAFDAEMSEIAITIERQPAGVRGGR
jgi:hypothetical protein